MEDPEQKDEIGDFELFDVSDASITYERSKDHRKVVATVKSQKPISEMKLYLLLALEVEKLESRLGISAAAEGLH